MLRKILFWSHLVIGVVAGIVILIKAVTGIALAFEPQIVEWIERDRRVVVEPAPDAARLDANTLVAKARAAQPKGKPAAITFRSDPTASASINFGRQGGTLYINPYTGEALGGDSKAHDVMHTIEDFHRWLGYRPIGTHISGVATIGFFLLALSGIYLWWPKKITSFNSRLHGKARDFNWHNVIGFWTSPVLAIICVTGVIITYSWANNLVYRATGNPPPPKRAPMGAPAGGPAAPKVEETSPAVPVNLEAMFKTAEQQLTGWEAITLRYPRESGAPFTATVEEPRSWGPFRRSQLTLDPITAEVRKWEPFSKANSGQKLRAWVRTAHTGEAGGIPGQIVALIACIGTVFLVWTGFALAWRRFRP